MLPPPGKCVWDCGRDDFNREHIIGLQIAKLFGETLPVKVALGRPGKPKLIEVVLENRVCTRCNGHWMRKLDDRMTAFMKDAIRAGDAAALTTTRQRTLAQWAAKVALLFLLFLDHERCDRPQVQAGRERFYAPADDFAAVYKHQKPPPRARIWLGSREPAATALIVYTSTPQEITETPQPDTGLPLRPYGYGVVLAVNHLVFVVRGFDSEYRGPVADQTARWDELVQCSVSLLYL